MKRRRTKGKIAVAVCLMAFAAAGASRAACAGEPEHARDGFRSVFEIQPEDLATTGANRYWVLEPGYRIVLEGGGARIAITVLDETVRVGPVETRVVEEREWQGGRLVEVSRNFYAMSRSTGDLYYFGEDVDIYQGSRIVGHEGSWRAYEGENRPGLMMPGRPEPGMRYFEEVAPGVAMDRAEIVSADSTLDTPGGVTLEGCLQVLETSALNPAERSNKVYAPGIGLVLDDGAAVVFHGFTADDEGGAHHETTGHEKKGVKK